MRPSFPGCRRWQASQPAGMTGRAAAGIPVGEGRRRVGGLADQQDGMSGGAVPRGPGRDLAPRGRGDDRTALAATVARGTRCGDGGSRILAPARHRETDRRPLGRLSRWQRCTHGCATHDAQPDHRVLGHPGDDRRTPPVRRSRLGLHRGSASDSKNETLPGTSAPPTATTPAECQRSSQRHIASSPGGPGRQPAGTRDHHGEIGGLQTRRPADRADTGHRSCRAGTSVPIAACAAAES
jgi:hypothetical protein